MCLSRRRRCISRRKTGSLAQHHHFHASAGRFIYSSAQPICSQHRDHHTYTPPFAQFNETRQHAQCITARSNCWLLAQSTRQPSHHYTMDPALSPLRSMQPATARQQQFSDLDGDIAQIAAYATALAVSTTEATLSDLGMHDIMISCPCARGIEKRETGAFWCTLSNSCHSVQHRNLNTTVFTLRSHQCL